MNIDTFLPQIIFYSFATLLLFSAWMVVSTRYPVRGVLFLVLAFFCSAILWMMLQAEFLALVLIFVYVGAVMTLFLFVVMMLNLDIAPLRKGWVKFLPLGLVVLGLLVILMWRVINASVFPMAGSTMTANLSNTSQLGAVLYTDYFYPFELAAVLLLVAIVAAIALAFRGRKSNRKSQNIDKQLAVRPRDRVELINLPREQR